MSLADLDFTNVNIEALPVDEKVGFSNDHRQIFADIHHFVLAMHKGHYILDILKHGKFEHWPTISQALELLASGKIDDDCDAEAICVRIVAWMMGIPNRLMFCQMTYYDRTKGKYVTEGHLVCESNGWISCINQHHDIRPLDALTNKREVIVYRPLQISDYLNTGNWYNVAGH